jgi:quercetin dioxygenase-like cupin family protein
MQIDFFDLLAAEGWDPIVFDQSSPNDIWGGGGLLADAPVDMAATFDGAMWRSTRVDTDFNMGGVRCRANFTVPWHDHNLRELIIVMGGEFTVEWGDNEERRTIGPGDFWISEAGTKHTMTAGPEGVTYVETWPVWVQLKTTWHEGGWVPR